MAKTYTLQNAVTTTATGDPAGALTDSSLDTDSRTFQATGATSSGSGSATIVIEVSNDNTVWLTLGTITLTLGVTATSDGFASTAPWHLVRSRVSAISGTGAAVTVTMGV